MTSIPLKRQGILKQARKHFCYLPHYLDLFQYVFSPLAHVTPLYILVHTCKDFQKKIRMLPCSVILLIKKTKKKLNEKLNRKYHHFVGGN